MSKPKFVWQENPEGEPSFPLYGTYGHGTCGQVQMVIYNTKENRYRLRCLAPKNSELTGKSTFGSEKQARDKAVLEAMRIYQQLPPVDYDDVQDLLVKAKEHDEIVNVIMAAGFEAKPGAEVLRKASEIIRPTGLTLEETAYRMALLIKMSGTYQPEELVGKYLDEFVRVRDHKTIGQLVKLMIPLIEGSPGVGDKTKRRNISILNDFADSRLEDPAAKLTIPDLKLWYNCLQGELAGRYNKWLIIRNLIEVGHKEFGAITKWVFERAMELDYWAKAGTLHTLMSLKMRIALVQGAQCANDVLFAEIMANVPIREAELGRLFWQNIRRNNEGFPVRFFLPAFLTKGQKGHQEGRDVDIPANLGKLLLALWRDEGPILVGTDHQYRLARVALDFDPEFQWEPNYFRRTCISNYVHAYGNKQYYADQAGHNLIVQKKRYLRYVPKEEALLFVDYSPDPEWVKSLPYELPEGLSKRGRPRKPKVAPASTTPMENTVLDPDQVPAPAATPVKDKIAAATLVGKTGNSSQPTDPADLLNNGDSPDAKLEKGRGENPLVPRLPTRKKRSKKKLKIGVIAAHEELGPPRTSHNRPPSRMFIKWPPDNVFFKRIWSGPATHIAVDLKCSQASVLMRARRLFGNLIPGHRYWQRKNAGHNPVIPAEVFVLQAKLDESAAAAAGSTTEPAPTLNAAGPGEFIDGIQAHDKAADTVGAAGPGDSPPPVGSVKGHVPVPEVQSPGKALISSLAPVAGREDDGVETDQALGESHVQNAPQGITT